jgi:hypothetical protein
VERVEMAQYGQGTGRPPHQCCHHAGDDEEDDQRSDFLPTTYKLEFPKFDGVGDPLS